MPLLEERIQQYVYVKLIIVLKEKKHKEELPLPPHL